MVFWYKYKSTVECSLSRPCTYTLASLLVDTGTSTATIPNRIVVKAGKENHIITTSFFYDFWNLALYWKKFQHARNYPLSLCVTNGASSRFEVTTYCTCTRVFFVQVRWPVLWILWIEWNRKNMYECCTHHCLRHTIAGFYTLCYSKYSFYTLCQVY
jgi:hypothetical protein